MGDIPASVRVGTSLTGAPALRTLGGFLHITGEEVWGTYECLHAGSHPQCTGCPRRTRGAASGGAQYYVSLGTSLAVGVQPDARGRNQPTDEGYADQLYRLLRLTRPRLQLVKLGCPGETSTTLIAGGLCPYAGPAASQLEAATAFLEAHRGAVTLLTLDIGANDVLPCADVRTGRINQPCVEGALTRLARTCPTSWRRSGGGPHVPIVALNYYNPFVAVWLLGPAGQAAARAAATRQTGSMRSWRASMRPTGSRWAMSPARSTPTISG